MTKGSFTECPKCGARVSREKLRRHINKVHGEGATKARPAAAPTRVSTVRFPWKAMLVLGIVGVVVFAGGYWFLGRQTTGGGGPFPPGDRFANVETNFGTIRIHLSMANAPVTAGNFINLANAGRYNDNAFNRVCAGFVIQGGDVPGASKVPWESTGFPNVKYSVAMARQGDASEANKDSASSTFFINLGDNGHLDAYNPPSNYPYVVFGHVVEGTAVVDQIAAVPAGSPPACPPNSPISISRVTISS